MWNASSGAGEEDASTANVLSGGGGGYTGASATCVLAVETDTVRMEYKVDRFDCIHDTRESSETLPAVAFVLLRLVVLPWLPRDTSNRLLSAKNDGAIHISPSDAADSLSPPSLGASSEARSSSGATTACSSLSVFGPRYGNVSDHLLRRRWLR